MKGVRPVPIEERTIPRDPAKEKYDWFAELIAELPADDNGQAHTFQPAETKPHD